MRFFITIITSLIWLAATLAAPPLTITDAGYFLTTLDESGVPTLERVETVVDLRTSNPPPVPEPPSEPDEPGQPEPLPEPRGISAKVAEWTAEVDAPVEAQKYALIFETVHDGTVDASVPVGKTLKVLKDSADEILSRKWLSFRMELGDYLLEQVQKGNLDSKEQMEKMLDDIRYGMAYAIAQANANKLPPADAAAVVSTVNKIIEAIE